MKPRAKEQLRVSPQGGRDTDRLDLCAVGELLDGVGVLCVKLQEDGHLERRGLQQEVEHRVKDTRVEPPQR